jgi:hypothetical protein
VVSAFQEVSMTVKTSISLTDEQESYARGLVRRRAGIIETFWCHVSGVDLDLRC